MFANAILIDSSAVIALHNPSDQFHKEASLFFNTSEDILWICCNATTHEVYTRERYDHGFYSAIEQYDFLRAAPLYQLNFEPADEIEARLLLIKYSEHPLSFHDALCAAVMNRLEIYKAFTFDHHFYCFGFEIFPGPTL